MPSASARQRSPAFHACASRLLFVLCTFAINSSLCAQNTPSWPRLPGHDDHRAPLGECRATGEVGAATRDAATRSGGRTETFDASCLIDLDTIEPADFEVVDVRGAAEFSRGHIRNAVNIPLVQLQTKRFLKSKRLLIVGNGLPQLRVGQFCRILESKGFSRVKVLRGGLQAWIAGGRRLSGSGYQVEDFETVAIADFFMDYDNRLVQPIDISVQGLRLERILTTVEHIPADRPESFSNALRERMASNVARPQPLVLIGTQQDRARAKSILGGASLPGVFYLIADQSSIAAFRRERVAINRTRVSGPTRHQCSG